MYGIILSNIRCSFVCVSIEQLPIRIDVGPACAHCTGDNCGKPDNVEVDNKLSTGLLALTTGSVLKISFLCQYGSVIVFSIPKKIFFIFYKIRHSILYTIIAFI
jgi:hypothetical protein